MRRVSYVVAAGVAVPAAMGAWAFAPVVPPVPVAALLTLVIAQVPLPKRAERPLYPRHARSELHRHLERRTRRAED